MIEFDYILRGYEVDEYCYIIIDKYGEDSDVVRCLDKSKDSIKLKEPDRVIRVGSFSLKSTDSIYLSVLWTTECASRKVLYLNDG